jgi:predicted nucleic acid-binding protein
MSGFVLDACAIIALLRDEPGGERVDALLASGAACAIAAVNLAEVLYDSARREGPEVVANVLADVRALPVDVVSHIDGPWLLRAVEFKSRGRVSLADAFALGLAVSRGARLVTADHHEFDAIERAGLAIFEWIR